MCDSCDKDTCIACGECARNCPTGAREVVGKEYTAQEVYTQIQKDVAFYGEKGGVTFSGGECMIQIESLTEVLKMCKENGIHTAVTINFCSYFKTAVLISRFLSRKCNHVINTI